MRTFQVLHFLSFLTFRIYDVSCSSLLPYRVQNRGVSESCAPIVRGKRCVYRITLKSSQFLGCTRGPNPAKPSSFQSVDQFPIDFRHCLLQSSPFPRNCWTPTRAARGLRG